MTRLLFVCLLLFSTLGQGAEFTKNCSDAVLAGIRFCYIGMHGVIARGDAEKLYKLIREPVSENLIYNELVLDSPGGDVSEALKLASIIKEALLETTTWESHGKDANWYPCVSACFLVWAAGTERSFVSQIPGFGNVGLGLHRPYFAPEGYSSPAARVADAQQTMTSVVREYLRRENVSEKIIESMLNRSSQEVYWLSHTDDNDLNGYAPWFEEMMIARCKFDKAYEREIFARQMQLLGAGKKLQDDSIYRRYMSYRKDYVVCRSQIKLQAQKSMRGIK